MEKSFLDVLKQFIVDVEQLYHRPRSDHGYYQALELRGRILHAAVTEFKIEWEDNSNKEYWNLKLSSKELDHYDSKSSDKRKEQVLKEFKTQISIDLRHMINA